VSTVEIKDPYLSTLYRNLYSQWEQSNKLGLEKDRNERMWPSTAEGGRGSCSPLGGVALPAAKIEK
jgi:hypothetical protein